MVKDADNLPREILPIPDEPLLWSDRIRRKKSGKQVSSNQGNSPTAGCAKCHDHSDRRCWFWFIERFRRTVRNTKFRKARGKWFAVHSFPYDCSLLSHDAPLCLPVETIIQLEWAGLLKSQRPRLDMIRSVLTPNNLSLKL